MQGLKHLLEACWQLSRGSELALAEELLPTCMAKVIPLAQQPSAYQQDAIKLAAQGFHLSSLFAFHRNDMQARKLYGKQAIQYSQLSEDQSLLVTALKSFGNTYYHRGQYPQALQVYQDASQHIENVSPLQQACIYMGLAAAYAHLNQSQEAFTYLGLAHNVFPDHPEKDSSFAYVEFDLSQMILWEGIIRSQLGQTQQALDIFNQTAQPVNAVSERIRVEIINQQAKTAIFAGDIEKSSTFVEAGFKGARALGSQRRYNEAYENFRQMSLLWPQEKRVTALGELLH